jgi:hypothetical protein
MRGASRKKDRAHLILAAGSPEWYFSNKTHIPEGTLSMVKEY